MEVTEVQVNLCDNSDERLRAYCAVIFDGCFVVHNVRVIEKAGGLLVAMPSRKVTGKCGQCGFKNPIDANYCSNCGNDISKLKKTQSDSKIHFDIAHPINAECRQMIEREVLAAYNAHVGNGG
ncbi:MAG: SpoVG family protein [Planctomycetales bacterium]|nr:SpoVG family protein [Planctomycetales bacterium]